MMQVFYAWNDNHYLHLYQISMYMWGYSWTLPISTSRNRKHEFAAGDVQEKTACYGNVLAPECILLSSHVIPTFFFRWVCPRWEWTTPWLQWTQPFDCRGPVGCHQKSCRPMVKIRTFQSGGQELGQGGTFNDFVKTLLFHLVIEETRWNWAYF